MSPAGALPVRPATEAAREARVAGLASGDTKLREAAREFEGLLVQQLFQALRKTVQPSGLLGDSGGARGTYEYLFDQAVVQQALQGGRSWGLAERLEQGWAARAPKAAVGSAQGRGR